jgi:hypothetical protein
LPERFAGLRSILVKHRDRELLIPYSDHSGQNYVHRALPDILQLYGNDRTKAFQELKAADIYLITHKPLSFFIEGLKAAITYWMPEDGELSTSGSGILRSLWGVLQLVIVAAFLLLSFTATAFGFLLAIGRLCGGTQVEMSPLTANRVAVYGIALLVVLYGSAISCFGGMGLPRFRETSDLLILMCAFLAPVLILEGVRSLVPRLS